MPSTRIASMFRAVSSRLSPLDTDDVALEKLTHWQDSRLAARLNDVAVRVEASKKRLTTVLPRRAGTIGIGRSSTSRKVRAWLRIVRISERSRPSMPRRCLDLSFIFWVMNTPSRPSVSLK